MLGLNELSYRHVAGFSHGDTRAFYIYSVLDEIQKTGVALQRWAEALQGLRDEVSEIGGAQDRVERLVLEQLLEEQDLRRRRLLEVLVELICFRKTNEQDYYRHLLLLRDLENSLSMQKDLRDFYACHSAKLTAQMEPTTGWLRELEHDGLDLARCWYLRNSPLTGSVSPGQILSSFRRRLKLALGAAAEHEKLVLGLSYRGYSQASQGVHFRPEAKRHPWSLSEAEKAIGMVGVLALNCLTACQELIGEIPDGLNRQIRAALCENTDIATMFESTVGRRLKMGDFVLAYHEHLAQIVDKRTSDFGYESYRVEFLEDTPPWAIPHDWLPAQEVRLLDRLDDLVDPVVKYLQVGGVPEGHSWQESEINAAIRAETIKAWRGGLRDLLLGTGRPQEEED